MCWWEHSQGVANYLKLWSWSLSQEGFEVYQFSCLRHWWNTNMIIKKVKKKYKNITKINKKYIYN